LHCLFDDVKWTFAAGEQGGRGAHPEQPFRLMRVTLQALTCFATCDCHLQLLCGLRHICRCHWFAEGANPAAAGNRTRHPRRPAQSAGRAGTCSPLCAHGSRHVGELRQQPVTLCICALLRAGDPPRPVGNPARPEAGLPPPPRSLDRTPHAANSAEAARGASRGEGLSGQRCPRQISPKACIGSKRGNFPLQTRCNSGVMHLRLARTASTLISGVLTSAPPVDLLQYAYATADSAVRRTVLAGITPSPGQSANTALSARWSSFKTFCQHFRERGSVPLVARMRRQGSALLLAGSHPPVCMRRERGRPFPGRPPRRQNRRAMPSCAVRVDCPGSPSEHCTVSQA
jgi:hypothetical protein